MDAPTRAVLQVMRAAGISVEISERDAGQVTVTARTPDGHRHIVNGDDVYSVVCLAAEATGVDLADG